MDRIREDTIKRLIHFLKEDKLVTTRSENWTEPAIQISVFQSLTKQTQERLHAIYRLADRASKASEDKEQANLDLDNCEAEYKEVHGPLVDKMTRVNETYVTLVDLELDHNNIRKEGNIITYERKIGIPNDDTLYQERVNNLRGKLENCRITLRNTCKMAQPTQRGLSQLQYRTVNARDFISDMHEKYSHYKKDKAINTMLEKLEYTMRMANRKIEEIEDIDDDMQARMSELFQRHFDEMDSTTANPKTLILSGDK